MSTSPPKRTQDRGVLRLAPGLFTGGRVFVVGDIHGCLDLVQRGLDCVKFDPAIDTLVSVGDLIDRGPDSARSALFLKNEFVYAVRGNHEDMLLRAQTDDEMACNFIRNGGQWWFSTPESTQQDILDAIQALPLVIEAQTPRGSVGFLHAEVPLAMDWPTFIGHIQAQDAHTIQTALWGRQRINHKDQRGVLGIGRLFCGHTPVRPHRLANIVPVDTGAVFGVLDARNEDAHLSLANILSKTQVLVDPLHPLYRLPEGALRIIDEEETTRQFSPYARARES